MLVFVVLVKAYFKITKNEIAMEHWSNVLSRSNSDESISELEAKQEQVRLPRRHYVVDADLFPGVYFTYREAQCMAELMCGKTIKATGESLGLSPRTVEYYLKNMKSKLKCRTKSELMQIIARSSVMNILHKMICT